MMLLRSLLDRRVCGSAREPHSYPLESLLLHYKCFRQDEHTSGGDLGEPVPPFGCLWSTANGFHRVLAVVNEEGVVKLYDTESHNKEDPTFREWLAHNNAVFDVAWVPGEPKLVTASGDQTARLWDVNVSELLGTFKGHQCSLKSVSFGKWEKAVFCTGGRDGNIMIWDTRCNKKDGFYRPVKQITGAHNALAKQTLPKQKKKRQTVRGLAPSVDFQQSVTVVLFQDENTLISAGAVDGAIKVWDLRKNYSVHHQEPMPVWSFTYPGNSTRRLGYSNLILDSTGSNLFANCTDDNIYMFNLTGLQSAPVATFSGHQNSTFYVKSSLSPDGHFLLSGSSDNNAYIWKVCDPHQPPTVLQGHSEEVTSVTWCPSDFTKIATCSDDNTVRIWRLNRGMKGLKIDSQSSDLVGYASRKKQLEREAVEGPSRRTPPRAQKMPTPSPSSLQQAACALGDLALPSDIPAPASPAPGPSVGNCLAPQATTSSQPTSATMLIKTWVIQSPRLCTSLPGTQSPSTTRMVLGPVGQSLVRGCTDDVASDKKVKRRLDTGGDLAVGHNCGPDQGYSCTEEAGPVFKRTKLDTRSTGGTSLRSKCEEEEVGLRHPPPHGNESYFTFAQLSPSAGLGTPSSAGKRKGIPDSPDKENSSPHKTDWLTAMGEKQRVDMGTRARRLSSSPTAPASQSPTVRRREERSAGCSPSQMHKISSYFQRKLTNDRSV